MRPMQHISYIYIYQNAPLIRIGWISIKKKKKKKKKNSGTGMKLEAAI
jgi:hypothetical protein